MRVPVIHEVEPALLHPAVEVCWRDLVGIVEDRVLRIEDGDRRFFHGDAIVAQLRRIGRVVASIEVASGEVLYCTSSVPPFFT